MTVLRNASFGIFFVDGRDGLRSRGIGGSVTSYVSSRSKILMKLISHFPLYLSLSHVMTTRFIIAIFYVTLAPESFLNYVFIIFGNLQMFVLILRS